MHCSISLFDCENQARLRNIVILYVQGNIGIRLALELGDVVQETLSKGGIGSHAEIAISDKCVCWNESEDRGPAVIVIKLKERGYSKECAEVETEGLSS